MRAKLRKIFIGIVASILIASAVVWGLYEYSLKGYRTTTPPLNSPLKEELAIFFYNQSQHSDPVAKCWYDSGDYIVFLHRNVESLFYLSLAYDLSQNEGVKKDLLTTINSQLPCAEEMLSHNYKQFRDQDSHGINLPPRWNNYLYPSRSYQFKSDEGKDIYLMLSLVYSNLGKTELAKKYQEFGLSKKLSTISENCCENRPLTFSLEEIQALEGFVTSSSTFEPQKIWGLQFSSLVALKNKRYDAIKGVLNFVQNSWKDTGEPFQYQGGNYDIAGTIALERMYAAQTGDQQFLPVSEKLYSYLRGENTYQVDFTNYSQPYHPCSFFKACDLKDTLIGGVDESKTFNPQRHDIWKNTEVELVGQSQYIVTEVIFKKL